MPLNEQWVCAGTKRISIAETESSPADGVISVYCRQSSNATPDGDGIGGRRSPAMGRLSSGSSSGDDCLHVVITDGVHTFYERIARTDIRHMASEECDVLDKVASILLRAADDMTFKVSYKRVGVQLLGGSSDTKNTTSVKVSVRKTCLNNIVRPVWEGQLNNICHSFYDDLPLFARNALPPEETRQRGSSGLAFPLLLGDTINKLHKEIDSLRTKNKDLEANTLRWKSTSDKLINQWETEKSELTDRFLTLFNDHKARHMETQKELNQLKGKKRIDRSDRTGGTFSNSSTLRKSIEPLPDNEGEHDFTDYPPAVVDRLANVSSSMKRPADDRKPSASQKQKRQNQHTGKIEFSKSEDMCSSSDEEDGMKD
ncbi:hypothetical protein ACHAXR_008181 [Thalassiosira sp. AJA248-18]